MTNNLQEVNTAFSDLHIPLGQKKLEYQGEDIYFKLTKGVSQPVKIESAPVLALGADGNHYDTKRYKIGLRNDWLTGIVSRKYQFVANEVAYDLVTKAGFKPTKTHFSKTGNAMFIEVFSDKVGSAAHSWSNDGKNGDEVNTGVLIRNSIDGTTSFGGDVFTYRARCSNGAIIGKKQLGSFSVRHVGEYSRLLSVFRQYLDRAFKLSQQVKVYYQKAAEVKVNDELAQAFVNTKIPQKFLPDFIQVLDNGKVKLQDKSTTVWDAFNQSTEKVWHLEKLGIGSKVTYTQRANTWLLNTVEPLVVTA